jgi:hypothetical protein
MCVIFDLKIKILFPLLLLLFFFFILPPVLDPRGVLNIRIKMTEMTTRLAPQATPQTTDAIKSN